MSDENCTVTCPTCGIDFSFSKKIEKLWRDNSKLFSCPNQHTMSWSKKTPDENEKELQNLRSEVKSLKEKLGESEKKITELMLEIEIWKPTDKT